MNEKKREKETEGIRTKRRMKGREIRRKELSRPARQLKQTWNIMSVHEILQSDSKMINQACLKRAQYLLMKRKITPVLVAYFFNAFVQSARDAMTGHDINPQSSQLTVPEPNSLS